MVKPKSAISIQLCVQFVTSEHTPFTLMPSSTPAGTTRAKRTPGTRAVQQSARRASRSCHNATRKLNLHRQHRLVLHRHKWFATGVLAALACALAGPVARADVLQDTQLIVSLATNQSHWAVAPANGRPTIGAAIDYALGERWTVGAATHLSQHTDRPSRRRVSAFSIARHGANPTPFGQATTRFALTHLRFPRRNRSWDFTELRGQWAWASGVTAEAAVANGLYGRPDEALEFKLGYGRDVAAITAVATRWHLGAAWVHGTNDVFDPYAYVAASITTQWRRAALGVGCTWHQHRPDTVLAKALDRSRCHAQLSYWVL